MKTQEPSIKSRKSTSRRKLPLYVQVAEQLRTEIVENHEVGDKLESGPTLARRLGVSVLTIREAVNALTQEGLLDRQRGSGTYVRKTGTKPVAIVIGLSRTDLRHSYFFLHLVHHLEEILAREKIPCRQYYAHIGRDDKGKPLLNPMFLEDVRQRQVALVVPVSFEPSSFVQQVLDEQGVPCIVPGLIQVDYDDMVRESVGYLLAHGRRRIALLAWPDEPTHLVFEGLLREAGIEPEPRWMKPGISMNDSDALHEALRQIWQATPEPPDGLVCLNDFVFERTIPTILELGIRVPGQLMIVTHANKGSGIRYPFPVAQMELDPATFAEAVAEQVRKALANEPPPPRPTRITHRWIPEQLPTPEPKPSPQQG